MNIYSYLTIIFVEYIGGFTIIFGACKTIDRIFRYPIKQYTVLNPIFAIIHPVIVLIFLALKSGVRMDFTVMTFTLIIWLFLTDKKLKSLFVSLISVIFSLSVFYGASAINSVLYKLFDIDNVSGSNLNNFYMGMICNGAGNFVALCYIFVIAYIGKGKVEEPISIWNMLALMLAAYLSGEFMMNVYNDENNSMYQIILFGYISISATVVLSVKSSESKFYSRISKINADYLNAQKKYYDSRQKSDTEIRRIKHDMKNHMICMNELCKKGKYEELENYISGITDMLNESDKSIHVGNDIADAIINDKLSRAERCGINLTVSGLFDTINYAPIDVCTILSNLLDNAIEATELLDESMRKVELSFKKNLHFILITVSNPNDTFVDTAKTAKIDKKNHGFGILNVKKAAERYGGELSVNCDESTDGYIFTAEVILPRKP